MTKNIVYYGAFLGLLYVLYGAVQLYNGVTNWWLGNENFIQMGIRIFEAHIPNAFPDPFSGFALITTGLLFLTALYHSVYNHTKSRGYLFAAWLLAMSMLILNIVEITASILDAYYPLLYRREPNYEWSLTSDPWGVAPHLVLGLFSLPLYSSLEDFVKELIPR